MNERDRRPIEAFVRFDRLAAIAGLLLLVLVNGLAIRSAAIWSIAPAIVVLIGSLTVAGRRLAAGYLMSPLLLLAVANWLVALVVVVVVPFLWPVMVITVLMPVILITSYVDRRQLGWLGLGAAGSVLIVAAFGLMNEDGGALPDIDDVFEAVLLLGGLVALLVPCGLIIWHTNQVQLEELSSAEAINEELRTAEQELLLSRRRVVVAADRERVRIERDLHDGAQQTLVTLGVRLRLLAGQAAEYPQIANAISELQSDADRAVEELRELAHGIYPPVLHSQGLAAALRGVARRSPFAVDLDLADNLGRLEPSIEHALYFVSLEALTNVAKHAPGSTVRLGLERDDGHVRLVIADDGPGFEVGGNGSAGGTDNMADRAAAAGGQLRIESTPGTGTTITVVTPVEEQPLS